MLTRVCTILVIGAAAGSVHLALRDRPILLSRSLSPLEQPDAAASNPAPTTAPGNVQPNQQTDQSAATPPTDTPDPYADYAANSLFDQPVKQGALTLREAFQLHQSGATFLDARNDYEFEEARIEGAIWMPASRLSSGEGLDDAFMIDTTQPVIIYCTGGECDASENTAIMLESTGLTFDIRILGMGYEDWASVGLPVEGPAAQNTPPGGVGP